MLLCGMSALGSGCSPGNAAEPRAAPAVAAADAPEDAQRMSCPVGRGDCDLDPANGCETDLTDADNCRFCGHACKGEGVASAGCFDGACRIIACAPGRCDQDGQSETGCESDSCG